MHALDSPLWVISSYFNPIGYQRRQFNYRVFRKHLAAPLLTVEWSPNGRFELNDEDADILLQIGSGDLMWQKERLLNLALKRLPRQCRYVAWIDCDVVFDNSDWAFAAMRQLESIPAIQLFSEASHLPPIGFDVLPEIEALREMNPIHRELSWIGKHIVDDTGVGIQESLADMPFKRRSGQPGSEPQYAPGIAWAATREVLDVAGFYDANIIGGGDSAIALASVGLASQLAEKRALSAAHLQHYLAWADTFDRAVGRKVSSLTDKVFHLWHGDFSNRQYKNRHRQLQGANFDPERDIRLSKEKTWEFSDAASPLREMVRAYFESRLEDG